MGCNQRKLEEAGQFHRKTNDVGTIQSRSNNNPRTGPQPVELQLEQVPEQTRRWWGCRPANTCGLCKPSPEQDASIWPPAALRHSTASANPTAANDPSANEPAAAEPECPKFEQEPQLERRSLHEFIQEQTAGLPGRQSKPDERASQLRRRRCIEPGLEAEASGDEGKAAGNE